MDEQEAKTANAPAARAAAPSREADAIYQNEQIVGRVVSAEVDLDAKEIRFDEITNTELLLLPDECEYQQYKILIQRVAYATSAHPASGQKGRILRGAIADILGYREK